MKQIPKLIAFALVAAMLLLSLSASLLAETARTAPEGYNEHDYMKVVSFLEIEDENGVKNGTKLNPDYDPEDPETWFAENEWDETIGFFWEDIEGELRLSEVRCYRLGLAGKLDLQDCSELIELYCGENMLETVCVLGCTKLEVFIPWANEELTTLDVTQCPALRYLQCNNCCISELDVSSNPELEVLCLTENPLIELDISNNAKLTMLDCMITSLTEIDVSNNPLLQELYICWNHIESLDVSNNTNLQYLICDAMDITELDVSANTELQYVCCCENNITEFDFTNNHNLGLDVVRAEEGGYVGCTVDGECNETIVIAEPWEGYEFVGWFDENDNLITDESFYFTTGDEVTVFIARFSFGEQHIPGDVDANGEVDVNDAILVLRCMMGVLELTPEQLSAADVTGDELIRLDDAITILRTAMGLLS